MRYLLKYLVPSIAWRDLPVMVVVAIIGAIVAGLYGIFHDQITFAIGPEYFTTLKFKQFAWANMGFGDRAFVGTIGFLATWWVGFIVAWFLARRLVVGQDRRRSYRQIAIGFLIVLASVFACGAMGYIYGVWRGPNADYSAWLPAFRHLQIQDRFRFVLVAYIHNAGYFGAAIGLVVAFIVCKPIQGGNVRVAPTKN